MRERSHRKRRDVETEKWNIILHLGFMFSFILVILSAPPDPRMSVKGVHGFVKVSPGEGWRWKRQTQYVD
jgi:hypothetical protein